MLITVHNLVKTFQDDTHALAGVSFSVEVGEYVAIVGPSGSGKSTLLHILGMLDRQTSGEYRFRDESVEALSEEERAHLRNRDIGFVFQMFNLLPRISVLENVMVPLAYSGMPQVTWERKAKAALEEVGLGHRMEQFPTTLSGGEKQRAAIARALINDPKIIFADEPTGNLDSISGGHIVTLLEALNAKGRTVLVITHDHSLAERARRVIRIKDGGIVSDVSDH